MAKGPQIKCSRIVLKPFASSFLTAEYVSWLNDPEVVRYSEQRHIKHTLDSCRCYTTSFDKSPHYLWAITTGDKHIGNISATVDNNNSVADVAILLGNRAYWGQGMGLEAWNGVCDFLFNELKIRKITAGTMSVNSAMLSIMEKNGMQPDGMRKQQFQIDDKLVDLVMMAKFNK